MKWSNGYRIRLVLVVFVAAIVLGGGPAKADFVFGEPVKFGYTVTGNDDIDCLSSDGLELYFDSPRSGGQGNSDLWVLTRASVDDDWGTPVNLGSAVNSPQEDWLASISTDGLTLYFHSTRPGGFGGEDIYVTTRASRSAAWGPAVNMGPPINRSGADSCPWISTNGLELYFQSNARSGGYGGLDIYVARRATTDDPWDEPENLGPPVNSAYNEDVPSLSSDGLLLFFCDWWAAGTPRPGGHGGPDMWMARRASLSDPWQTPVNLGPNVNEPGAQALPRISPDGRTLYFWGYHSGAMDVWQAPIIPIVDFNSDGIVDIKDLVRLIESWGKNDSSVDMGPMPWGDGKIDAADLQVLMSYWEQEILDLALAAYWKLDETEGLIAVDSAGENDATLSGGPLWQPEAGQVGGALQLDGVDDCVITPFILNPADGPFSVFAWVKGGIAGQVIVSQIGGADWLCADPSQGRLMTGLVPPPSRTVPPPLVSELVITDGNWHRIGFVWDGSHRRLYVDGVVAAEDAQDSLAGSGNGLYIGCGKARGAGTFWSGLIDDVRIYDRAVSP